MNDFFWNQDADRNLSPPPERPPSTTPAATVESLGLKLIAVKRGKPVFPSSVLSAKFEGGSDEHEEVLKLKAAFEAEFGAEDTAQVSAATEPRTNAACDFTVDEGLQPLDITRTVELRCLPVAQMTEERRGLGQFEMHYIIR